MKKYVLTHGIACIEEKDGKRELVTEISGITTSLKDVQRLVTLCNEGNLSPEHLKDVVDDLIQST